MGAVGDGEGEETIAGRVLRDIDDEWRERTLEAMRRHKISIAELARRIGASKGSVSSALSGKTGKAQWSWKDACDDILRRAGRPAPKGRRETSPTAPPADTAMAQTRAVLATLPRERRLGLLTAALNAASDDAIDILCARLAMGGESIDELAPRIGAIRRRR